MKNEKYYVGLDLGTDSVGYAVTNEEYDLCKFRGEPMWGSCLFESGKNAGERRGFRTARRRLERRKHRLRLLQGLFAEEMAKVDKDFFIRINDPDPIDGEVHLFENAKAQREYARVYPTIHHLINELMSDPSEHDIRLVYIACAWLIAHRGHFLSGVDKNNVREVTKLSPLLKRWKTALEEKGIALPFSDPVPVEGLEKALQKNQKKEKEAGIVELFPGGKIPPGPEQITENEEEKAPVIDWKLMVSLLCGGSVSLAKLFDIELSAESEKKCALDQTDEEFADCLALLDDVDAEILLASKAIYDWSVLVRILNGKESLSAAKVELYEMHGKDLKQLKDFMKFYLTEDDYKEMFLTRGAKLNNYVAYSRKEKWKGVTETEDFKKVAYRSTVSQQDFIKYVRSKIEDCYKSLSEEEQAPYRDMFARLQEGTFMPKQVNGDNRAIPYQLYWNELKQVLENAEQYLPFLKQTDEDMLRVTDKILCIMEFRIPYYVGPLKGHWMVRREGEEKGRIYPWNFEKKVDLDASENEFIRRMTNSCTYLFGEDVLPDNSLLYASYAVLNIINPIKINDVPITVEQKQGLYIDRFQTQKKVTKKAIEEYFISRCIMRSEDKLSGLDEVGRGLAPYLIFRKLLESQKLTSEQVEKIIRHAAYSEDKHRLKKWLMQEMSLNEEDADYIAAQKLKGFGKLSQKLLSGIPGMDKQTHKQYSSIIRAMWETNKNLNQLLSADFTFYDEIEQFNKDALDQEEDNSLRKMMQDMGLSGAVKRTVTRALDVLQDVRRIKGTDPTKIFVEMARGSTAEEKAKGKTSSRYQQLTALYESIEKELREGDALKQGLDDCQKILKGWSEDKGNQILQNKRVYLYCMQLGRSLYTGNPIAYDESLKEHGKYNIEHIYPKSKILDNSLLNNLILVETEINGGEDGKKAEYPINTQIQHDMRSLWDSYRKLGLITEEKYHRLIRTTGFTNEELRAFVARQLVETRQGTKAVTEILQKIYPKTKIVFVKAARISEFRHYAKLLKSRVVNDLHHAKDAYLCITVGNLLYSKFDVRHVSFDDQIPDSNFKPEVLYKSECRCNGRVVWRGIVDVERVKRTVMQNTAHLTCYTRCQKGQLFKQTINRKNEGLVPVKKDRPTDKYGGYNSTAASFFVLVRFFYGKKKDVMLMPVELLAAEKFDHDENFAKEYAKKAVATITKKPIDHIEFLLNRRKIRIKTVLSLDGMKMCITGKQNGGMCVTVIGFEPLKLSFAWEQYIKHLESFENKRQKWEKIGKTLPYSKEYDQFNAAENVELYDLLTEKWSKPPYVYRPNGPFELMTEKKEKFAQLPPEKQAKVLLNIIGLLGRAKNTDFSDLREPEKDSGNCKSIGGASLSTTLSNWKKKYRDVRLIDTSCSGLYEQVSGNLLDLL